MGIILKSKNKTLAKKKADKYFSEFIRKRDENKPCITCGQYKKDMDAGHFISRRFEATRYDEMNCNAQCLKCNRFENGNQFAHGKAIDRLYGLGTSDKILALSRKIMKRTQFDYEVIADYYKSAIEWLPIFLLISYTFI